MKTKSFSSNCQKLLTIALISLVLPPFAFGKKTIPPASFADFDRQAREGKKLSVVFFGGSLTWGDGASYPERTSFRALLQNYFEKKYPDAHFVFHNAAIGGTGSKLGMFRINRDVLAHKPDLVFLDFTTEDKLSGTDRETLASYERILRDLIREGIPVVQIIAGTKNYFGPDWTHIGPQRLRDHAEMANLYHTAIGNSFPIIQKFLENKLRDREEIWPTHGAKPGDLGHRFIYEATRAGLEEAIYEKRICNIPREPVFASEYDNRYQFFSTSSPLPPSWRLAKSLRPTLTAMKIANDWKGQIAVCDISARENVKPLQLKFNGTFLGILGEADEHGLGFKISIDGEPILYEERPKDEVWPTSTIPTGGGERFFWHEISDKIKPGRHTLEILPVFPNGIEKGALRIESICVAGPDSEVAPEFSATPAKF
jgi:lysophospholipase L1-like esterase